MRIKFLLLLLFFSLTGSISAQSDQKVAIKKVIERFFKGLQNGDTVTIKETLIKTPILQTTAVKKDGSSVLMTTDYTKFLKMLAAKKADDIWEEKLLSYNIQIDGNMANVWTPYKFYRNYDFSHCGVNSFQLILDNNTWKIIYLIDTRRSKKCN